MNNGKLTVLDLFSGIGGFSLGLERTGGFKTVAFCEIEPYSRAVLQKHWPTVPCFEDIRTFYGVPVDVVCGGFPCQPFSTAARGRNNAANLWPEMLRVIQIVRPSWVIGENVAAIDGVALEKVLVDLESLGYETQTFEIPACATGKDHLRRRLWILGYSYRYGQSRRSVNAEAQRVPQSRDDSGSLGTPHGISGRLDRHRMRALGNAIVPQIAEIIGRAILDAPASQ